MTFRRWTLLTIAAAWSAAPLAHAQSLVTTDEAERMGLQVFWQATAPLPAAEMADRVELVDDNLYLMTPSNIAVAVHAGTGVTRWVSRIADPGQTVRGPTHSESYAFFTRPAAVRILDRRTGLPATQPRSLRGVVIIVEHDVAEISLGRAHGLRLDHVLNIIPSGNVTQGNPTPIAKLEITVVGDRKSKGRLIRSSRTDAVRPGDAAWADVEVPLESISLPFAASSAAVGDDDDMFVGAANERMYSLRVLTGFENWRVYTPKTMTGAAALYGDSVYFCDQDGRAASATKRRRERNWEFHTEGPIFLSPLVTRDYVFVASSDRSLYCLQRDELDGSPRRPGERVWQKRFDEAPEAAPVIVGDTIYYRTVGALHAVKVEDGSELWTRPGTAAFLTSLENDVYIAESSPTRLVRLNSTTGEEVASFSNPRADYIVANAEHQLIIFGTRFGRLTCLRPSKAPFLRAEQLALVLQNDRKARALNTLLADARAAREEAARAKAEAERPKERPNYSFLEEDNWLTSSSDRPAVGTRGLLDRKPADAAPKTPAPAADAKKPKDAEPASESTPAKDDEWGDDWGDDDKADDAADEETDESSDAPEEDAPDDSDDEDDDW